jgi:Glycosyl hydrolase family 79 C-terminal beta domain
MNHTNTVHSVNNLVTTRNNLAYLGIPYVVGETNSLYNEGAPGLSNAFGAALWGVDFNLWCASQSLKRVHMHQGTDYRYAAWQPVQTNKTTIGTKAPYYGSITVAAMLGDLTRHSVQIANLPLPDQMESAYAAYENGKLARIAVINMRQYNYTVNGTSSVPNPVPRESQSYTFQIPSGISKVSLQRLAANGSDAITGITFDGWSYNYELQHGRPVRLHNVTIGEQLKVSQGSITVSVPDSSAVILNMQNGW